ncbi:MAG: NADH:ubiquinone oxidoreductase subunit NDUFA12 [Alphaproteobacteria bacterium]|nr:NADH:ubiquinone oxidoreductase subunit NDUFA12 [Alphaproteobacteria bacterium]
MTRMRLLGRLFQLLFTWWNGATIGTLWTISRTGQLVGEDEQGNRYYQQRGGSRRWVVYNGYADASRVPPEWHPWLHHTLKEPPTLAPPKVKPWEKEHVPNMTGTPFAYRPPGSLAGTGARARGTGDYEAWKP